MSSPEGDADDRAHRLGQATPDDTPDRPGPGTPGDVHLCDLCGSEMVERHCKLLCLQCGYQRDCSDP